MIEQRDANMFCLVADHGSSHLHLLLKEITDQILKNPKYLSDQVSGIIPNLDFIDNILNSLFSSELISDIGGQI